MSENNYASIVHEYLASTAVKKNLEQRHAVVLERIARGGGATNWYFCENNSSLDAIEKELSPGSVVTFYFDGRIVKGHSSEELSLKIEQLISSTGDCVIGSAKEGSISIVVDFVTDVDELLEFVSNLDPGELFFFGQFPARDNDGINALTITLPDADGVVRAHPH